MNLFIIENDGSIEEVLNSSIYSAGMDIIICFNYLCWLKLAKLKGTHNFYFLEEFLERDDYRNLHQKCDFIDNQWYRSSGDDKTFYKGVSYGDIVSGALSRKYMLSILLKYGEIIRKVVLRWPSIHTVYSDFSNLHNSFFIYRDDRGMFFNKEHLLTTVCEQLHLTYVPVAVPTPIPSSYSEYRQQSKRRIKNAIRKYLMKTLLFVLNLRNAGSNDGALKGKIYFDPFSNINSTLSHMNGLFVLGRLDVHLLLQQWRLMSRFPYCDFDLITYRMKSDDREYLASITSMFSPSNNQGHTDCDFSYNGIDYKTLYLPAIADLAENVFPELIRLRGKVLRGLRRFNIQKVVIKDDRDETMRTILDVAKTSGVRTYWVDHGIQGHDHAQKAFDSKKSDEVICSGSFYADYYKRQGDENRRCVVLGNPSMDLYPAQKRKRSSGPLKNILFLTFEDNFYARLDRHAWQEKYFQEIFSTFEELARIGITINIKPHPGEQEDYLRYLFDFFNVDARKIKVIRKAAYPAVIRNMDLQVSNITACFYEGQAAGVPTIFMEPNFIRDSVLPPLNGQQGLEVLRVSTGKELLDIIKSEQGGSNILHRHLDNFLASYAPLYMGPLDGCSGKRIVEYLLSDEQDQRRIAATK